MYEKQSCKRHLMRRAILWLDHYKEQIALTVVAWFLAAFVVFFALSFRSETFITAGAFPMALLYVACGAGAIAVLYLIAAWVCEGWVYLVEWAKSPPKVEAPLQSATVTLTPNGIAHSPVVACDPFLEAAQREVESIAPN